MNKNFKFFHNKKKIKVDKNSTTLDLANLPLIDRDDFTNLYSLGTFSSFKQQAIDLNQRGYTRINLDDPGWLNLLDKVNDDIDSVILNNQNYNDSPKDRLQDAWLHYNLESVRSVACHPEILNVLKILFGRDPFPFQTLNFTKGSSQSLHSDASHFHCIPEGYMCGIWVALEDVVEESGPLFYYPCSHRLPYISAKNLNLSVDEINSEKHPQILFEVQWKRYIADSVYKRKQFLAKRGDILIWHANLLHGGSIVRDSSKTRYSQVSHYFFRRCAYTRPFWDCINNISDENKWFIPNDLTHR